MFTGIPKENRMIRFFEILPCTDYEAIQVRQEQGKCCATYPISTNKISDASFTINNKPRYNVGSNRDYSELVVIYLVTIRSSHIYAT